MFAGGSNGLQMNRVFPLTLSKIIRFSQPRIGCNISQRPVLAYGGET